MVPLSNSGQAAEDLVGARDAVSGPPLPAGIETLVMRKLHRPRGDGIHRSEEPHVQVRRVRVAGVAAAADQLAPPNAIADHHAHRPRLQMTKLGELTWRVLEDDEVPGVVSPLVIGLVIGGAVTSPHHPTVGGCQDRLAEAGKVGQLPASRAFAP